MSLLASFMVPHPPLIIPEVGCGREKMIQETIDAYHLIGKEIASLKPDLIILSSPHAMMYSDYFSILPVNHYTGSFERFGASQLSFSEVGDKEFIDCVQNIAKEENFPMGVIPNDSYLDHGSMVPLYFIRKYYNDFSLMVVGISGLSYVEHYRAGMILQKAANALKRHCVYIASGDLSHKLKEDGPYGFVPESVIYDQMIMKICKNTSFFDFLTFDHSISDSASECGHRSFLMMSGFLDGFQVKSNVLSYQDVTGVGYGICSFYPLLKDSNRHFLSIYLDQEKEIINHKRNHMDSYVSLAFAAIQKYVLSHERLKVPTDLDDELLTKRAGVFVSIHKFHQLRGCIGTVGAVEDSIAEEIIDRAISACSSDPRFSPITEEELDYLDISVDVLGPLEEVMDINMLDEKKYGIVVTSGFKRGVLLPNIDSIHSVSEQIEVAKSKANISSDDVFSIQRFEVIRHF